MRDRRLQATPQRAIILQKHERLNPVQHLTMVQRRSRRQGQDTDLCGVCATSLRATPRKALCV